MKRLTTYLNEKLVVNKNYNPYICAPKSFAELRKIIEQRYKEQGPGTKQNPINFNDIDVSNINSFYNKDINNGIFGSTKFKYIDISEWNVSKVEDMKAMFWDCWNLKSVGDLSNWDVSKVENMYNMFYMCEKLKSVGDLSKWKVSKVENMERMFYDSGIKNKPRWYK